MDGSGADLNARGRLLLALLVSAALHLSLMFGVAVRAPPPHAGSDPILARIEGARLPPGGTARRADSRHETPDAGRPVALTEVAAAVAPARERAQALPESSSPEAPVLQVQQPSASEAALVRTVARPPPEGPLPPVEMPLLADPTWYPAAQLDVFPVGLEPVRPAYPEGPAAAGGGEVTLLLLVDETGRVHEAMVVDAWPQGAFEDAALAAFRAARFVPGSREGRAVRSRVLVKVGFKPAQAGLAPR